MIQNIRWPVYLVAVALILLPALGSFYAIEGISDSASTIGLSPAVILELDHSAEHLKKLAKLDASHADEYRAEFNHLEEVKQNYAALIELSPSLHHSYLLIFFLLFGGSLAAALVLATWLNHKIIRSHEFAIQSMQTTEERNSYLENREAWRLVAQKFVHEVKNPLTPMLAMVSHCVLRYKKIHDQVDPEFMKLLGETKEIVEEEVSKIARWVEAFSKYARVPDARLETVSLHALLERFESRHRDYWPNVNIQLQLRTAGPDQVRCDPELMNQVLFNLVKNSVEAAAGQPLVFSCSTLERATERRSDGGNSFEFTVSDNGQGMPEKLKQVLFTPYTSTKLESGGMGLGLAICKKIMLEQGGDILFQESPLGCKFKLKLMEASPA